MRRGPATTRTVLRVHPPERESVLTQSTGTIKSSSPGSIAQVAIQPVPAQLAVVAVSAGCTTQPFPLAHAISASWCIGRCQRWMHDAVVPFGPCIQRFLVLTHCAHLSTSGRFPKQQQMLLQALSTHVSRESTRSRRNSRGSMEATTCPHL